MKQPNSNLPFIILDESKNKPLHRQIYEAIRQAILSGDCRPLTKLPSTRALADHLSISRTTVVNAYEQLFAEGYLEGKQGRGTFVASHLPEEFLQAPRIESGKNPAQETIQKIEISEYGRRLAASGKNFLRHHGAAALAPFQHSIPAVDEFPFEIWSRIAQRWQKKLSRTVLGYGRPAGFRPLREAVAAHLKSARGLNCTAEQVMIVNGTQQALDLISRIFLDQTREVLIEDPGYLGARDIFAASGAKIVSVPIDAEGIDLEQVPKKTKSARLIYVTPSHQYPLGVTMSLARRLHLLEWAGENGAFIIEDDYDSEYRYAGRPLPSLQGLDRDGRVIYVGTFSKTVFPSLRLGCLVVPEDLIEVFEAVRAMSDLHSSTTNQAVLADFIAEGHFTRHLRRMRGIYAARQQILVSEMQKYFRGLMDIAPADLGMDLIAWLPNGVSDREPAQCARQAQLRITPLSDYCFNQTVRGGLFLGYTAFNEIEIINGVKRLAKALDKFTG